MKNDACVVQLVEKLSLDKEFVIRALDAFVAGLVEELLEKGEVPVRGLGCFKVVHIPSRKTVQGSVAKVYPPRRKVVFFTRSVIETSALRILERKTSLSHARCEQFYRILVRHFRKSHSKMQGLSMEGLGSFTKVDGKYIFVPDRTLEEIVNNAYDHLSVFEIEAGA
ncbi:hypothetical protein CHL67_09915 [Prosthecochloris sp. GSB1]|uniref:HU family DNA-binding protein n=1 Tax=Prosthecochloris sp. GSB1 TaxID=281093 RepID=UPI000B8D0A58|nr:HU family DNA-binding protein [Prosthecochloris sp. GSB1]ASQ91186.1 hypothetical protein CHL67_09915 [Prosthecochloris sp. GSB1]